MLDFLMSNSGLLMGGTGGGIALYILKKVPFPLVLTRTYVYGMHSVRSRLHRIYFTMIQIIHLTKVWRSLDGRL